MATRYCTRVSVNHDFVDHVFKTKHYEIINLRFCDAAAVRPNIGCLIFQHVYLQTPLHCASFTK